jgi:hypothetical protein
MKLFIIYALNFSCIKIKYYQRKIKPYLVFEKKRRDYLNVLIIFLLNMRIESDRAQKWFLLQCFGDA